MSEAAPPSTGIRRSWQTTAGRAVLWGVLFVVVVFARRPETFLNPQFWAEDGPIFFGQADEFKARALTTPSAGYNHFLLRLVAAAASPLDARWIPAAYCGASLLVLLAVALALFSPRIDLPARPACMLALVLMPHTGEAIGNLTNLQWVCALGLVWLLLAHDAGNVRQHISDVVATLVLGLTGTFSILFTPLFAWRAWRRRTRASLTLALLLALAAGIQIWTLTHHPYPRPGENQLTAESALWLVGLRLPANLLVPQPWAEHLPRAALDVLGALTLLALLAVACVPGKQRERRLLLVAVLVAIVAATFFRGRNELSAFGSLNNGDRYFFIPKVIAVWLLIFGWSAAPGIRWATRAACALMLIATAAAWRYERLPDQHWADYARRIEAGETVDHIPVNPGMEFSHPGRHRP